MEIIKKLYLYFFGQSDASQSDQRLDTKLIKDYNLLYVT